MSEPGSALGRGAGGARDKGDAEGFVPVLVSFVAGDPDPRGASLPSHHIYKSLRRGCGRGSFSEVQVMVFLSSLTALLRQRNPHPCFPGALRSCTV